MEHLRCVVERITYQNAENGYSVIKCRAKAYQDLVTVVGSMPDVHVGSVLYLGGSWRIDAKYGRQFSMESFEEKLPATVYGMEKYLGSGLVKGVGPKFAGRIVKQFGARSAAGGERHRKDPRGTDQKELAGAKRDQEYHALPAKPRCLHLPCHEDL